MALRLPATLACILCALGLASAQVQIGEVLGEQKISDTAGGFEGTLQDEDGFGWSVTGLGDLNGDGIGDAAVGAWGDDDGGDNRGAIWILFLRADGTVDSHQKISSTAGNFTGQIDNQDRFGYSVAALGDHDGDGVVDLATGALFDGDGGYRHGAVWILFLNPDGTVKAHQKISDTEGDFDAPLDDFDYVGSSVVSIGDFDGDGVGDLATGAYRDGDGENGTIGREGSVYMLMLRVDGTVKSWTKIGAMVGGFNEFLSTRDNFGRGVASIGDLDRNGYNDLAVGTPTNEENGIFSGAVWILFMRGNATVRNYQKINAFHGDFDGELTTQDRFGFSMTSLGDINADGSPDLAVGAIYDDDGGPGTGVDDRGAVWVLMLRPDGTVMTERKISDVSGHFDGVLDDKDYFGHGVTSLGDIDGDGRIELMVGATQDDDGDGVDATGRGAVWYLDIKAAKTAHWSTLGHGLAGAAGLPTMVGDGALVAEDTISLALTNALPSATATLYASSAAVFQPFFGGTMVPDPTTLAIPQATSPAGKVTYRDEWPAGIPSGLSFYFQSWIEDPAGLAGFAASNAVVAVTP